LKSALPRRETREEKIASSSIEAALCPEAGEEELVFGEESVGDDTLLIEEIQLDGICGVY
jgi:mycofactocin precursor